MVCEQQRTKESPEERTEQSAVEGMGIGSSNGRGLVIHKNTKHERPEGGNTERHTGKRIFQGICIGQRCHRFRRQ